MRAVINMGMGGQGAARRDRGVEMLDITDIKSAAGQAVLQETRLRIVAVLASAEARRRGGYSLQELGQLLDCSPQNAHHHLKILERANLARVERTEATQRIPRQFWVSDLQRIRLSPVDGGVLDLDLGLPDETLERLSAELISWAKQHGGEGSHRVALQLAAFVASLDPRSADHLMEILRRTRSSG